ncbi:MAG: DUF1684 domain-containing protein [Candidatus Aminicenantes bacterium]|nr:DUF1684 domain-containing protein [Candidatus Aminicenantes bacterium]
MKFNFGKIILFLLVLGFIHGCEKATKPEVDEEYVRQIQKWQRQRLERLKSPDSWLSLAGLYWLETGENTFGRDSENDFIIDKKGISPRIGVFILENETVRFETSAGVKVFHQGQPITEINLEDDSCGKPTVLKWGSLSWYIIKRDKQLGVRLKDARHPRIQQLKQIDAFPVDKNWKIKAVLKRYTKPRIMQIPTVLGTVKQQPSPGILVFQIGGKEYRLHPGGNDGDLSVIFGDLTNTHETYGGGRFLVVKKPDEKGETWIDFNQAYNPPCVFSPFATCSLPPEENQLPLRIVAGEKMVKGFAH